MKKDSMWVHKYSPKELKDIIGVDKDIDYFINEDGLKNNHSFIGIQGLGKSTLARVLVEKSGCQSLKINVSDERGIDVVRGKIKDFVITKSMNDKKKIVILEEFDAMTPDAMRALRDTMESFANNANFIITANYEHKIIDPIFSRCPKFSFNPERKDIFEKLKFICINESVEYDDKALNVVIEKFYPDIRGMINEIQQLNDKKITVDRIDLEDKKVKELVDLLQSGRFKESYLWILNSKQELTYITKSLFKYFFSNEQYDVENNLLIEILADTSYRINNSTDKQQQMAWGLKKLIRELRK